MIEIFLLKTLFALLILLVICIIMFAFGYFVGKEDGARQHLSESLTKPTKYSYKQWMKDNPETKID